MRWIVATSLLALLGACASTPDPIADADDGPALMVATESPQDWRGERVRWGGTITEVENAADVTRVYVVARALHGSGRPRSDDESEGRFIAVLAGFHDPVVLARGREITVVGTIGEAQTANVGGYEYRYLTVSVEHHRLWPKREAVPRYPYPPYYYDPWYDPWRPYPYFWPRRRYR